MMVEKENDKQIYQIKVIQGKGSKSLSKYVIFRQKNNQTNIISEAKELKTQNYDEVNVDLPQRDSHQCLSEKTKGANFYFFNAFHGGGYTKRLKWKKVVVVVVGT